MIVLQHPTESFSTVDWSLAAFLGDILSRYEVVPKALMIAFKVRMSSVLLEQMPK